MDTRSMGKFHSSILDIVWVFDTGRSVFRIGRRLLSFPVSFHRYLFLPSRNRKCLCNGRAFLVEYSVYSGFGSEFCSNAPWSLVSGDSIIIDRLSKGAHNWLVDFHPDQVWSIDCRACTKHIYTFQSPFL